MTLLDEDKRKEGEALRRAGLKAYAGSMHPFGRYNPISSQGLSEMAYLLNIPLFTIFFIGLFATAVLYGLSYTFHLFPLAYVGVFVRCYIALVAVLFIVNVLIETFKTLTSREETKPAQRITAFLSAIFSTAISIYAIVMIFKI